jgi:hypothetical protein
MQAKPPSKRPRPNTSDTASEIRPSTAPSGEITEEKMEEILIRARQTVKPRVNREAASEVVSEEILSFKMKRA